MLCIESHSLFSHCNSNFYFELKWKIISVYLCIKTYLQLSEEVQRHGNYRSFSSYQRFAYVFLVQIVELSMILWNIIHQFLSKRVFLTLATTHGRMFLLLFRCSNIVVYTLEVRFLYDRL